MTLIKLNKKTIETYGSPLEINSAAPSFTLIRSNLSEATLESFSNKLKVLNIFPSIDTPTCSLSVKQFNEQINSDQCHLLNISADLPFAYQRFCKGEQFNKTELFSCFRSTFSQDYRVMITTGLLKGLCARVVYVLSRENKIIYSQVIEEITNEPNYKEVINFLLQNN
jgi:thioredoxin-dependent peroxiredoxin